MINRIRSAVNFIANNQVQGNITPLEFNIALNNAMIAIYNGYFSELNTLLVMETKGHLFNGMADMASNIREKIHYYLTDETIETTTLVSGVARFDIPEDCRFVDGIFASGNSSVIDVIDNSVQFTQVRNHKHTRPTLRHPIGLRTGNSFSIAPEDVSKVTVYYLRHPKHPNWTFRTIPGSRAELFDPSNPMFQDVDMHESEEMRLILGVLTQFGINLKDMELLEAAQVYSQQENTKNVS